MGRRKHVTLNALQKDVEPPQDNESIVRALGSRGSNIMEVRWGLGGGGSWVAIMRTTSRALHCFVSTTSVHPPPKQVEFPDGKRTLCIIPAKFHKKLWIRNGSYLMVEADRDIEAAVSGQVTRVLFDEHVKQLQRMPGVWCVRWGVAVGFVKDKLWAYGICHLKIGQACTPACRRDTALGSCTQCSCQDNNTKVQARGLSEDREGGQGRGGGAEEGGRRGLDRRTL